MTRPTDEMASAAKAALREIRDADDGQHRSLLETLGRFFPGPIDFGWLDDEYDQSVATCFTCDDQGWLTTEQDAAFWRSVEVADRTSLITCLESISAAWQSAPADAQAVAETQAAARYVSVEPVPGDGYPGWWQGYDTVDQVWKYVHHGDQPPADDALGWVTTPESPASAAAEPVTVAAAARRFEPVDPVPGDDYPGWWQGYDTVDRTWKYAYSGAGRPADNAAGWTADLLAAVAAQQEQAVTAQQDPATDPPLTTTANELANEPPGLTEKTPVDLAEETPADLASLVAEAVATTIAEVRELGVSADDLSDAEIIAVLQESLEAAA